MLIRHHIQSAAADSRRSVTRKRAVRLEELVNYFTYDLPAVTAQTPPNGEHPFTVSTEMAPCPWQNGHQLLRVTFNGETRRGGKQKKEQSCLPSRCIGVDGGTRLIALGQVGHENARRSA